MAGQSSKGAIPSKREGIVSISFIVPAAFPGLLLLICLYRVLLDLGYFHLLSKTFGYYGFRDYRSLPMCLLSWLILLASFLLVFGIVRLKQERYSSSVVTLLYLISFVPFTTCIYADILDTRFILENCVYWCCLLLAERASLRMPVERLPILRLGELRIDDSLIKIVGVFSILLVVYISGRYAHFRLNFNLFAVYDYRMEARTFSYPAIISYMFAWTRAINPVLFAYNFLKKNRIRASVFFLSQMLSFGIDGLKSTFFMPFLFLLVILIYKKGTIRSLKLYLVVGAAALAAAALLEYLLFRTQIIMTLVIRRICFVTNYLSNCYSDFFSRNPPDYFRSSFLRLFGASSPYTKSARGITYIIGALYFGKSNMNCNNGLVSDAITNLGVWGLPLMPLLLVFVLRLFDRCTLRQDRRLVAGTSIYVAYSLLNTFLMTVLLTHGVLVLMLLFWLMKPEPDTPVNRLYEAQNA